jgi:ribosome-associated translation inhibitor RaiA
MDKSQSLVDYILKKLEKLKKFMDESANLELYFNFDNRVFSPALVVSDHGKKLVFHAKSKNPYRAVNKVYDKAKNRFAHR